MPLPAENLLSAEASPYLRQHKDNPVHWRPWSAEALAEAREASRPILLSIGYAACHWCHVMAHESFEDEAVAAVMNRLFVNIKVDREERPDIDQIYMAALTATGEQGGWPLTMFLTPSAEPFWGGTYFPKKPRYGRPGFVQVLQAVHAAWRDKREGVTDGASHLTRHLRSHLSDGPGQVPTELSGAALTGLAAAIQRMMDPVKGGLRGAPKFPNAPFLMTLWLDWLATGNAGRRDAVLATLRHMLSGGIYDHVGGGMSRYSTDEDWLVPHFEKMLYDNAQLIRFCCWAYAATGEKLFRIRVEETIGWLLREMRTGDAFASSLDADSEGGEGSYYSWTPQALRDVLGPETAQFLATYELSTSPAWEGDPILNRSRKPAIDPNRQPRLDAMLARLREVRENRPQPGRDDKVLVDWNGLAIRALAEAGRQFGRADWLGAAVAAYRFIAESTDGAGRLPHSIRGGRRLYPAMATDYAAMINATIALGEATGDPAYADQARRWMALLDKWYGDGAGSHYLTASDAADVPIRVRGDMDEAVSSSTSQIIEATARLATLTGDIDMQERAYDAARAALGRAAGHGSSQAGIVNSIALLLEPRKLLLVEATSRQGFVSVANRNPDPRRVDLVVLVGATASDLTLPGETLPDTARPAAWLCRGQACLPPISDPEMLEAELRRPAEA